MTDTSKVARGADWTVAVILTVTQALASLFIGAISLLFVMISDGCGTSSGEDVLLCSTGGTLIFFAGLALEWLLLAAGVVVSIVLLVRSGVSGRPAWHAPITGTGVGALGLVALVLMLFVVTRTW